MSCRVDTKTLIEAYVSICMLEPFWHMGSSKEFAKTILGLIDKHGPLFGTDTAPISPKAAENVREMLNGVIAGNTPPVSNFPGMGGKSFSDYRREFLSEITEAIVQCRD